jgi:hypothetical protein
VPVSFDTKTALEDIGEHLSPKYTPAIIAPAVILRLTFPLRAIIIRGSPTILAVPVAEPIRKDDAQQIRNVKRINVSGCMSLRQ